MTAEATALQAEPVNARSTTQPTVLISANRGYALTSSRELLIRNFLEAGWQVVLATADDVESQHLVDQGAHLEPVDFHRGGLSAIRDPLAFLRFCLIARKWRPALVQNFHAKPIVAGTLATRMVLGEQARIVNTITGLGHAFIEGGMTAKVAGLGYNFALPKADLTIFQNRDDRSLFIERGWVPEPCTELIVGSGIDVKQFTRADRTRAGSGAPVVVMLGRLLRQKGLPEFVRVARRTRDRWPEARFLWAGEDDPVHPDAVPAERVRDQEDIEYLGRLSDVRELLAQADLLLFPSYREGVPRAVMEAASMGLPTVAFDVPGVREVVSDGETGYLVPPHDVERMSARVAQLLDDEELRTAMGRAARQMCEESFDIRVVCDQYLDAYRKLGVELT